MLNCQLDSHQFLFLASYQVGHPPAFLETSNLDLSLPTLYASVSHSNLFLTFSHRFDRPFDHPEGWEAAP